MSQTSPDSGLSELADKLEKRASYHTKFYKGTLTYFSDNDAQLLQEAAQAMRGHAQCLDLEPAAWEARWPGEGWEPVLEPTPDRLTRIKNSGREVRPLFASPDTSTPRVPKVRTSHHRNKEEAERLQKLVNERLAPESPDTSTDREGK